MSVILQVTFPFEGPFGKEMASSFKDIAESINQEDGFQWKIWTENEETHEAGGIYAFDTVENAEKYLNMHTERLASFGIHNVEGKIFNINIPLSEINQFKFN
ncbi:monooxygenase [Staphylococcus canis]|uniref:Monooxygenase n=1 Tax=Staphylococcus canis TaxID=2724942 RepID=A0ABS0T7W5_9STAP|nr:monooxygenase [Staphylococcus canis]MBI5974834.1 monooxygenase [Staphylococcus canis]